MTVPPAAPLSLIAVGYWDGPHASPGLPQVSRFVDPRWDEHERDAVVHYVSSVTIATACMGYSQCRFCGIDNGTMDLTDGVYVWPQGLSHYLTEHHVRLPKTFVEHAALRLESIEAARSTFAWWQTVTGPLSQVGD